MDPAHRFRRAEYLRRIASAKAAPDAAGAVVAEPVTPATADASPSMDPRAAAADAHPVGSAVVAASDANAVARQVLREIRLLEHPQPGSRQRAVVLFVLSLLAFIAFGTLISHWSQRTLLTIIGVLLLHESGHFLAMRLTGYRKVSMFFIPLFGAAVQGHGRNISIASKVLVALAGPVPGIVLGAMLTCSAIAAGEPLLFPVAMALSLINGLNLLPVLPLDGGHVIDYLLASRYPWSGAVFRVVCALSLGAAAASLHSLLLGVIGGVILLGIPSQLQVARIVRDLRRDGSVRVCAESDVPEESALLILRALQAQSPALAKPTLMAQQTIRIADLVNAVVPRWWTVAALLGVHAVALAMAVVFGCTALAGQHGMLHRHRHPSHAPVHAAVSPQATPF